MNILPICNYIEAHLNTYVYLYTDSWHHPGQENLSCPYETYPELTEYFIKKSAKDFPMLSFVGERVCFVHFSTVDGIYVMGPLEPAFSGNNINARHRPVFDAADSHAFLAHAPVLLPQNILSCALLLYNVYQENALSEYDCIRYNFDSDLILDNITVQTVNDIFSNRENQRSHNSYHHEMRLLKSIEDGNPYALRQIISEPMVGELGTTAKDPVRNGKNMAIYMVTASGRAAIRGGLPPEFVFSLTDSYSQQIEDLSDMMLLMSIVEKAEFSFAQMVADLKSTKKGNAKADAPIIDSCKDYIFKNLHGKLTVSEIADVLRMNPDYLGALFHRQEGVSLYQYILQQKIELAKNLLTYSDYSFIDIANYLGFSSQSHLGAKFKAATGITLKRYRDIYKPKNFNKESSP